MSKIYEALRQAELDRAQRNATQTENASAPTAQAVLDPPPPIEPGPVPAAAIVPPPVPGSAPWAAPELAAAPIAVPPMPAPVVPVPFAVAPAVPAQAAPAAAPLSPAAPLAAPVLRPLAAQPAPAIPAPIPAAPAQSPRSFDLPKPPAPIAAPAPHKEIPASAIEQIAAAEDAVVDLSGVRVCQWSPAVDQLPALHARGSSVEQFRSLRSRMYEFRDLNALKSILVSSGLPREGKSFVAANLAISFARHKAGRVLLIDGDMRRASLHKVFGTAQGPGLTEFLAGKATIAEIMQRPAPGTTAQPLPVGLATLTFIPGGNEGEKAADLSGNHRFDRLIAAVSPFFDWIVVDSSPVNLVSDGVNLAHACDACLLIARAETTKYESAQRALNELKATKILGYVLNAVPDPPAAGGYYGYDGYDGYDKEAESPGV